MAACSVGLPRAGRDLVVQLFALRGLAGEAGMCGAGRGRDSDQLAFGRAQCGSLLVARSRRLRAERRQGAAGVAEPRAERRARALSLWPGP